MTAADLREALAAVAAEAGAAFGVAAADPFPEVAESLRARVAAGHHGGLGFTFRDPDRAADPGRTRPWATRLVAVAVPYVPQAEAPDHGPRIARYAAPDAYRRLADLLDRLAALLVDAGFRAEPVYDDASLVDRAVAVRAGVGWWGRSSMVLVPGAGPWTVLGSVATDAPLPTDRPTARTCGTCTACIPACPTGAIVADGVVDARRCLAAILQRPGVVPRWVRPLVGSRLYGCDDCLVACPPGERPRRRETPTRPLDLVELLGTCDRDLLDRYGHLYLPGRRPRYLRRNALVVAGNLGDETLVPVVAGFLGHPDPLLRIHAAWATARLGGPIAEAALAEARRRERDRDVLAELDAPSEASSPPAIGLP